MSGANTNTNTNGGAALPLDGLDFDAIALERRTVPVKKGEHTWWLRWDVPAEIMVARINLRDISERTDAVRKEVEALTEDAAEQVLQVRDRMVAEFDAYCAEVLRLCGDLFRHSLPGMRDAEIAEHFNTNEQRQILDYFFTRPMRQSSPPPGATSAASPATTTEPTTEASQNRATRRGTTTRRRR